MLELENLTIRHDGVDLLRGFDLTLSAGETLGLVGESGSGKSLTALAIMGLLPAGMQATGRILFEGQDLLAMPSEARDRLRGRRMGMVFQEPMTALNPVMRVGEQIVEGLVLHGLADRTEALCEAARLLERVRLDDPERRLRAYPHELSGGQRQRVLIAMAIACKPALLIADEPTSALDVTVQAQILELLRDLQRETGMAMLFISHDLGVIRRVADQIAVLYAGMWVERGPVLSVLRAPRHRYTQGLIGALPFGHARLTPIPGQVPPPRERAPGCSFFGRCVAGDARCQRETPPVVRGSSELRCFNP